jgi:membrane protein implicated in regulation of membrane protease activity
MDPGRKRRKYVKTNGWLLASFLVILSISGISAAQSTASGDQNRQNSSPQRVAKKIIRISGELSDDGKTVLSESDGEVWTVTNPDRVKGHEGQLVILRGQADRDENTIHVFSVKVEQNETTYTARSGDSAFRR